LTFRPIVLIDIAVLALPFRVALSVCVRAFVRKGCTAEAVIAVIAHALGEVLQVRVLAVGDGG